MAPLLMETNGSDLGLIICMVGSISALMGLLASAIVCGCCDEKEQAKPAQNEPPKSGREKSTREKSGREKSGKSASVKKGPVDIRALSQKYKVSEIEMQTLVDRFKAMDLNNDGSLTETELVQAMTNLGQPITREQAAKFIKQYDRGGDRCMQLEEFLTMVTRRRKWSQPDAEKAALKAFKEFDKNNDGNISPQELCAAMTEMGDPISVEEAGEMIKMADKNKDGKISYEEFVQFWKQYTVG